MSEALELKPCPFCGGDVEMNDYTDKPAAAWVLIHRCSVIGAIKLTSFDGTTLAREWNTRSDLCDPLSDPRVAALVEALRLHKAWADAEESGPDYGGQTRDTHPDGERIWRQWWEANLSLCDRANRATDAALAALRQPD